MSLPGRADQIHSYHPPIASNGLYWTTQLPRESVQVEGQGEDFSRVVVQLSNLQVVDEPKAPLACGPGTPFPASTCGPFPATISMKLTLEREGFLVGFTNPAQQFHLRFAPARASLEFTASTPSLSFSFKSAPAAQSETIFAMMGTERNGSFF